MTRYEEAQAFLAALAKTSPELPFEPTLLPSLFASTTGSSLKPIEYIASLVERSQGLAVKILRLANSAYYGMSTTVSTLPQAIRILGLNELRNILLQIGLSSMMHKMHLPAAFPFEAFHVHHILTANIARCITKAMPENAFSNTAAPGPDEIFAAALLHDMGKTLIASQGGGHWEAIQDLALCENIPFHKAEEDYWGIDHSVIGARMLTFWGLPQKLTALIGWHHAPRHAENSYLHATCALSAADMLAHHYLGVFSSTEEAAPDTFADLPKTLLDLLPASADKAKLQAGLLDFHKTHTLDNMAPAEIDT
ncbi:HD family phosphohydrolase [Deltaproteobacteria bacterium]|nr:HD family phosphohydrolase [Deltaproteobacteria bacterium]